MKVNKILTRMWLVRLLILTAVVYALYWYVGTVRARWHAASLALVDLSGVQHLGDDFNIPQFYVNRYSGGNISREGEGGDTCCVLLPRTWRSGLTVEVRWDVGDWSHENRAEVEAGNYRSIVGGGAYIAQVPVERYEVAEHVWVHFFPDAKVRVVSSSIGSAGPEHPIHDDDPHAIDSATAGKRVADLFTPEELAEMKRKGDEDKAKHGDWR